MTTEAEPYAVCDQKSTANALFECLDGDFTLFCIATKADLREIYMELKFTNAEKLRINQLYYYCQINDIRSIEELEGLTEE